MSKIDRQKEKARRTRRMEKKAQVTEELAQREDNQSDEELPVVENPADDLSKDYGMAMMDMPMDAPTTFEELDAARAAREQAEHVQEVTWDTQMLVNNILNHPELDATEKSSRIQAVATGFDQRVTEALAEPLEKSVEAWQAQALLAGYERNLSFLQKAADVTKAVLSAATRKQLSDSDFALVYKDGDKVIRKYPIYDKAHVRNAMARAAQQDDEDARKAMPKIMAAAKKFGIDVSKSAILIEKDAKGDWRWVGRPTNNFIDLQTDIISKSAHEKYAGWLDSNPEMAPGFCTWHLPGTARTQPADFWMEQDGALIMSGVLTEREASALFKMQTQVDLGMSFQGMGLRLDPDPRVITDYWMYEVSDLPLDKAANPFTALETMIKEVGMDKLQYLAGIMGSEEKAKAYLEKTGQMQKDLQAAGITSKANEEAPVVEEKPTPPTPAALDVQALIPQIAKALRDELDIDGLEAFVAQAQEDHAKVETLEELVKALNVSREDALVEALTPPVGRYAWSRTNRPSQADRTKLSKDNKGKDEEDGKLLKAMPGVSADYWLSQLTGTAPITSE